MADNVTVGGIQYATQDVGGVQHEKMKATGATGANMAQLPVTTSRTAIIVAANANRRSILLFNAGSTTVYVHKTSGFTLSDGWPLVVGGSLAVEYTGALYVAVAAGTGTVNYWEDVNA
jgi:hypothetical protein